MLHLLQTAVNPLLSLKECVENWDTLSLQLREPPRRRECQLENLATNVWLVS